MDAKIEIDIQNNKQVLSYIARRFAGAKNGWKLEANAVNWLVLSTTPRFFTIHLEHRSLSWSRPDDFPGDSQIVDTVATAEVFVDLAFSSAELFADMPESPSTESLVKVEEEQKARADKKMVANSNLWNVDPIIGFEYNLHDSYNELLLPSISKSAIEQECLEKLSAYWKTSKGNTGWLTKDFTSVDSISTDGHEHVPHPKSPNYVMVTKEQLGKSFIAAKEASVILSHKKSDSTSYDSKVNFDDRKVKAALASVQKAMAKMLTKPIFETTPSWSNPYNHTNPK